MRLEKEGVLTHSIEINTTAEEIFRFIRNLDNDENYKAWHTDHVSMHWSKGLPWQEGSVVYAKEYFGGKLHKLKFVVTKVVANREIEYVPVSWFMKRYVPKLTFSVEPKNNVCIFTASTYYRLPFLPMLYAKKHIEKGLDGVRKHIKEEGENLKIMLESNKITGCKIPDR